MTGSLFSRLNYYFKRSVPSIKILGLSHFFIGVISRCFKYIKFEKGAIIFERWHTDNILNYIDRKIAPYITVNEESYCVKNEVPIIWVCWWQGLKDAPDLIKKTIRSIIRNCDNYDVRLIDKNNLQEWIELPAVIVNKSKRGGVVIQHLTDIIRFGLISKYGGIWLDANIIMVKPMPKEYGNLGFYSCHPRHIGKWHVGLIGGTDTSLFKIVYSMMIYYWENNDHLIDYFFTDRLIQYCYLHYSFIRDTINDCPDNNPDIQWFIINRNGKFDSRIYNKKCSENYCFKLTTKTEMGTYPGTFSSKLIGEYLKIRWPEVPI